MNVHIVPVSVIIPVWRNSELAAEAVASVFSQTFRPVEVILVDDASDDTTMASLLGLQSSYPPGWIRVLEMSKNGGPGEARNLGMDNARGKYIAFLDADDLWDPRKMEIQYAWMERNVGAALCCTGVGHVRERAEGQCSNPEFKPVSLYSQLYIRNIIATSSVMMRATCHRFAYGKRHSEDYLLWTTIMLEGGCAFRTTSELAWRRKAAFGEAGLSGQVRSMYFGALDCFDQLKSRGLIGPFSASVGKLCVRVRYYIRRVRLLLRMPKTGVAFDD